MADIQQSGHVFTDIVFIGSETSGHSCTWDEFVELANFDYDSGFGSQKVAADLIIVFSDGAKMWRHEYDGSEHWQYSSPFKMPEKRLPVRSLVVAPPAVGWCSLADINADLERT